MEPRSFDRGDSAMCSIDEVHTLLQWSRGLLTAETPGCSAQAAAASVASMEPRSFDRGDKCRNRIVRSVRFASMEPRSFDRGDINQQLAVLNPDPLQWSRGLLTAETWL